MTAKVESTSQRVLTRKGTHIPRYVPGLVQEPEIDVRIQGPPAEDRTVDLALS
jgi:hypothetical protein